MDGGVLLFFAIAVVAWGPSVITYFRCRKRRRMTPWQRRVFTGDECHSFPIPFARREFQAGGADAGGRWR